MGSDHSHLSRSCLQISFTRQIIMVAVVMVAEVVVAVAAAVVAVAAVVVVVEYRACQWLYVRVQKLSPYII
jgi:hypothetical protein